MKLSVQTKIAAPHLEHDFLKGGGSAGKLIREYNWSHSPIGKPNTWPQALRTLVTVMLNSQQPMFVAWGPERTLIYNDGYIEWGEVSSRSRPAAARCLVRDPGRAAAPRR